MKVYSLKYWFSNATAELPASHSSSISCLFHPQAKWQWDSCDISWEFVMRACLLNGKCNLARGKWDHEALTLQTIHESLGHPSSEFKFSGRTLSNCLYSYLVVPAQYNISTLLNSQCFREHIWHGTALNKDLKNNQDQRENTAWDLHWVTSVLRGNSTFCGMVSKADA